MLHPSYTDLMKVVNKDVEEGATKGCKQPLFDRDGHRQEGEGIDRRRYAAGCSEEVEEAVVHRNQRIEPCRRRSR